MVNPKHYETDITPIHYILANKMPFAEGNVIKYVSRHHLKGGAEDLKKAITYLQFILEDEYGVEMEENVDKRGVL